MRKVRPRTNAEVVAEEATLRPSSLRDHVVRLYDIVEDLGTTVKSGFEQGQQRYDDLNSKFQTFLDSRKVSWVPILTISLGAIGLFGTTMVTALTTFWFVMTMKIDGTMNPIRTDVTALTGQVKIAIDNQNNIILPKVSEMWGQNQKSMQDREDMKARIDRKDAADQIRDLKITALVAGNVERESQFHFEDEMRNTEYAQIQRDLTNVLNMAQGKAERAQGPWYFPSKSRKGNEEMPRGIQ